MRKGKSKKKKRGPFNYCTTLGDKEIDYRFPNKKEELEYIENCETLWGGTPLDVGWATTTNSYQELLKTKNLKSE